MAERYEFKILMHRTGLQMAICPELRGFVVHAHSEEELDRKLPLAMRSFMKTTTGDDSEWVLTKEELAPGYTPLAYIAARAFDQSRAA
jgi:hypothetical protein